MSWRTSHGNGKGKGPRIETLPLDEFGAVQGGVKLKRGGATKIKLARSLTLKETNPEFVPYSRMAEQFRKHQSKEVARQSGGFCGAAPCTMIASAALQLAASRYLFDQGAAAGDPALLKQASALANDSRQNLLAAFELAKREADARTQYERNDPHKALSDALSGELIQSPAPRLRKKKNQEDATDHGPTTRQDVQQLPGESGDQEQQPQGAHEDKNG